MANGGLGDKDKASAVPEFDLNHSANVTAVLDKTAILNCRVKNVGNKTVSSEKKVVPLSYLTWVVRLLQFLRLFLLSA